MSVVQIEIEDRIAQITMDDGKANAVSHTMLDELHQALDQAEKENCVVVLTGRPGRLSAGFDLSIMQQGGQATADLVVAGAKLSQRLLSFPTPVILACSGHSIAMGALMLLSTDYRLGVQGQFKIGLNEVAIGMTMPYFGVHLGQNRLAPAHVGRSVINAEIYDPEGAIDAGFLDEVVEPEALLDRAKEIAQGMTALNMTAHHQTKLRIRQGLLDAISDSLKSEFGAQ